MGITLSEMMKKAEKKGYKATSNNTKELQITRPWQDNSITHNKIKRETADKPKTNEAQTKDNESPVEIQTVVKPVSEPVTNRIPLSARSKQTSLARLSGTQREIALFIYKNIIDNGGEETQELCIEHILNATGIKKNTIKTSILRLKRKGYLNLSEYKDGRGGWSRYTLDKNFIAEIQSQSSDILSSRHKLHSKLETSTISSSSNFNNNKTTTNELPENWKKIKTQKLQSALNDMNNKSGQIFNLSQVKAIFNTKQLTAEQVQKSIDHFTYGILNYPDKAPYNQMKKPAGFLVDTLKNGNAWVEPRYLSPEEQLIKKIYENIVDELETNKRAIFDQWLGNDTERKREIFRARLPSNHYFGENEFREVAWNEFDKKEWPLILRDKVIKVIGEEHQDLIQKLISLDK